MGWFDKFFGDRLPSQDKFARMVMDRLRKAGEHRPFRYDPQDFRLQLIGQDRHTYLGNIYQEYCRAPKEARERILINCIRTWFAADMELPDQFEDARHDILPSVRSRCYFEFFSLRLQIEGGKAGDWPHQVLADHLGVGLVYDWPGSMQSIAEPNLDQWGVSFYQGLEAACESLREMKEHALANPLPGLYISAAQDNYDASRMLLLDMIGSLDLQGQPVVMLPNRDSLIITGSEDETSLAAAAKLCEVGLDHPRSITGLAFCLSDDGWQPWLPERGTPSHTNFKLLETKTFVSDFSEQKQLLDTLHQKRSEDLFVASYSALQNTQTDAVMSYCVWARDVAGLLPRTDKIALVSDSNERALLVDWEQVEDAAGELLTPTELYPPRYRVEEFPEQDVIDKLAASSGAQRL